MATISLTLPVSGTVVTAGLHSTNYTIIQNAVNGGLDTANWGAGPIFAPSKFMQEAAARQDGLIWNGTLWAPKAVASVYDRNTAGRDVTLADGVAEIAYYSKSIAGNDMGTNKMLRLTVLGDFLHNNVAADTVTLKVKFGGTIFWANPWNFGVSIGAARHPWGLRLCIANLGATNSQMIEGNWGVGELASTGAPTTGIGSAAATGNYTINEFGIATLGAIDTTAAQTLELSAQWSAASANNSWRMRYALLEIV